MGGSFSSFTSINPMISRSIGAATSAPEPTYRSVSRWLTSMEIYRFYKYQDFVISHTQGKGKYGKS